MAFTHLPDRKPIVKMESRFKLESRDARIGVRVTDTQREELEAAAIAEGKDLSTYSRECLSIGHKVKQAGGALKVTLG